MTRISKMQIKREMPSNPEVVILPRALRISFMEISIHIVCEDGSIGRDEKGRRELKKTE